MIEEDISISKVIDENSLSNINNNSISDIKSSVSQVKPKRERRSESVVWTHMKKPAKKGREITCNYCAKSFSRNKLK